MSFKRTNNSIQSLSSHDIITLDLLFDMMICVSKDIVEHNNTTGISKIPAGNKRNLLLSVSNVMRMVMQAYENNKDGTLELEISTQRRLEKLINDVNNIIPEIEKTNKKLEEEKLKEEDLTAKQAELQISRGHLLTLQEKCEELQRQIDILSDSELDKKAEEKRVLENDLSQRKTEDNKLNKEISKLQEVIRSQKESIQMAQTEKQKLEEDKETLIANNKELKQEIEKLKSELIEYKALIENNSATKIELDEQKAKITVIINAINSTISDDFLCKTLFLTNGATDNLCVKECPDYSIANTNFENIQELKQWFDEMDKRINGLIEVSEAVLKKIVEQSDELTKDSIT